MQGQGGELAERRTVEEAAKYEEEKANKRFAAATRRRG